MPEAPEAVQRLAIYARVSTDEQREGQTIDSQVAELERFSREKIWPVVGIYKDDGWSGGVMERPELDRMRDDARKAVFDAVLINDVDRLARDVAHLGVIKRDLERNNVKVIFRKLPSDSSPTSNLMVNILGSFAEFERELIADRTRRGRRHKIEVRKEYLGSNTAYGYRYIPMNRLTGQPGVLQIEPTEARTVQQMFEWVDREGFSAQRVLMRLKELDIRPKMGASQWAKSSVLRILHSETYAGIWHYNKFQSYEPEMPSAAPKYRKRPKCRLRQRPKSEWLPLQLPESLRIVPRDRWERVQRQIQQNSCFSPRNECHQYLLKGLVQCGACGARLVGDPCHSRFYYRCSKRCKRMPTIPEEILNKAVKTAITNVLLDPTVILNPLRKLNLAEAYESIEREKTAQVAERESKRLDAEEQRILEAYRAAIISPSQLAGQLEKLGAKRATLELQTTQLRASSISPQQVEKSVADYCTEAAANLASFADSDWMLLLRTVIQSIVFRRNHITIRGLIPVADDANAGAPLAIEAPVPVRRLD